MIQAFPNSITSSVLPTALSSITESKPIKAVKDPWRRSSGYRAVFRCFGAHMCGWRKDVLLGLFSDCGLLTGTTSSYLVAL